MAKTVKFGKAHITAITKNEGTKRPNTVWLEQEVVTEYTPDGNSNNGVHVLENMFVNAPQTNFTSTRKALTNLSDEALEASEFAEGSEIDGIYIQRTKWAEAQSEKHAAAPDGFFYTTSLCTDEKTAAIDIDMTEGQTAEQAEVVNNRQNVLVEA